MDFVSHCISDDDFVSAFRSTTSIVFVLLSGVGTSPVGRRLQLECGIPVVLAWDDHPSITDKQMAFMVSTVGTRIYRRRLLKKNKYTQREWWCGFFADLSFHSAAVVEEAHILHSV